MDPDDAWEYARDKYWEDHELNEVAGIDRDDAELAFLRDAEEKTT